MKRIISYPMLRTCETALALLTAVARGASSRRPLVPSWTATALKLAVAVLLAAGANAIQAADKPAAFKKPAWLTDVSIGVKESYDNNVFMSGATVPATYTVPAGSAVALPDQDSLITTISTKLGFNLLPLVGGTNWLQSFTFGYAGDFVMAHAEQSESFNIHRVPVLVKGGSGAFSFNLENGFSYIDGSQYGATYPGGLSSAYATAASRERREQIQDRAKVTFQYDLDQFFIRPTASLLYYDLRTKQINSTGYGNYCDRYDVNGGADLGFRVKPQLALTVGYRYGHQYQEQFGYDASNQSSPSDYQRILFGVEGKVAKWLKVVLQGGPDFRNYADNTATHVTPVDDPDLLTYYGEASITAEATAKDSFTFNYKQWQWVSGGGKIPSFDSLFNLTYRRKLNKLWTLDLGARYATANYHSGSVASSERYDSMYSFTAGIGYAANANLAVTMTYAADLGRNLQDSISNPQNREFDHHLVSLGGLVKF